MREETVAGADERQSMFTNAPAGVHVLLHDGVRLVTQECAQLRDGCRAVFRHDALHARERP